MKTLIHFNDQTFYNPTHKVISKILRYYPAYFEMSLYLMKSRLNPKILQILMSNKVYQIKGGGYLFLNKNMVYLKIGKKINSLDDIKQLEKLFEKSKNEVMISYIIYPENIKRAESFHKMLGAVWRKNS